MDSSDVKLKLEKFSEKASPPYPCQSHFHQMSSAFEISPVSWILPWVKCSQVWWRMKAGSLYCPESGSQSCQDQHVSENILPRGTFTTFQKQSGRNHQHSHALRLFPQPVFWGLDKSNDSPRTTTIFRYKILQLAEKVTVSLCWSMTQRCSSYKWSQGCLLLPYDLHLHCKCLSRKPKYSS